jgi:hypothetical protein
MKKQKAHSSNKEDQRRKSAQAEGKKLAEKYPDLLPVPEEERLSVLRKAVLHPALLIFALLLAFLALPQCLAFCIEVLALSLTPITFGSAVLLFVCSAALFGGVFFLLRFVCIPYAIRYVVRDLGYKDTNGDKPDE